MQGSEFSIVTIGRGVGFILCDFTRVIVAVHKLVA